MYKKDFPIFKVPVYGRSLVFLDTAASSQKPEKVLNAMYEMASKKYANIHRGVYFLSEQATSEFEKAREIVADFVHASTKDIIFTRGATDSINLVAGTYGRTLCEGDEIVLSVAEHHSNLVPWQLLQKEKGIVLKFVDVTDDGLFDLDAYQKSLTDKTKLVAMTHVSNVLGTIFPVDEVCRLGHAMGAKVLIDGCQGIAHEEVDVKKIDCDFYAFSGHKIYGPTGIGVLYARHDIMQELPPLQGGGDMVKTVTLKKSVYADTPARFEAGTPAIVEAIGLGIALQYVTFVGIDRIKEHEKYLMQLLMPELLDMKGVDLLGTKDKVGLVSFNMQGAHSQDVALLLDQQAIAVRTGHHCAMPIHKRFGVTGSIRVSLGLYNDEQDIQSFIQGLYKARELLL